MRDDFSADDYANGWSQLLPKGPAWPRDPDSVLMQFVAAMAKVWGDDVDVRTKDLRDVEAHPNTANEMLGDWERVLALPEPPYEEPLFGDDGEPIGTRWIVPGGGLPMRAGVARTGQRAWDNEPAFDVLMEKMLRRLGSEDADAPESLTLDQRRTRAVAKMTARGGQSRQYFLDMAIAYGHPDANIQEFSPVRCGRSRCGSKLWRTGSPYMRFYWRMYVDEAPVTYARCGRARCGRDPQARIHRDYALESYVKRWKPAHTKVLFLYTKSGEV